MTSSATPATDWSAWARRFSSFLVIMQKEMRFIGSCWKDASSLALEIYADDAGADAKLCSVLQHGGTHALFVEECSVRGIQVFQIDVAVSYFEQAVMPGNFGVFQDNVRTLAAQDDACFLKFKSEAF